MSEPTLPQADDLGAGGGEEASTRAVWHESRPTFTQLPEWLLFHPEVSDGALRTWLVLATFADNRSGEAFPRVSTIAKKRQSHRGTIQRHLDELDRAGAIRRHHQYREDGGLRSTLYVLAWAQPLDPAPPVAKSRQGGMSQNRDRGPRAKNATGARRENATPITRPIEELEPLTPSVDNSESSRSDQPRGGGPPRTPSHRSPQKKNPRALGTNPRALAQKAQEAQERAERIENAHTRGYRTARLTEEPVYGTVEEYREQLTAEAARHLREIDAELLEAELGGYAAGLASRVTASSEQ